MSDRLTRLLRTAGGQATSAPAQPSPELLRVRDLRVWYPIKSGVIIERQVGSVRAVDGIAFDLRRGETLGLVGESGCGKTTTGRAIIRLLRPTTGSITFDGTELANLEGEALRRFRRRMQMIFQDPYSSLNPRMNVGTILAEPQQIHELGSPSERRSRVRELLDLVGLNPAHADRYPHEFSGGQRQRIGIARALAVNPDLIVADEPVSALDVSIQAQIVNLLERLQRDLRLTYLFIAHDLSVVRHISDRIAVMYLGTIVEVAPSSELYRRPLHPYTVALLSAIPVPDPAVEAVRRRIILRGDVPSPADPPAGCRFHTRCWLRERLGNPDQCVAETPPLREAAAGHAVACHFADDLLPGRRLATSAQEPAASAGARPRPALPAAP